MKRALLVVTGLCAAAWVSPASAEEPKAISVEFRGTLRDGLREIASEGGVNLIATGDLSEPAEVYLKDVTAEAALSTVAEAYHLKLLQKGSIWTLRPMTKEERQAETEAVRDQKPPSVSDISPAPVPAPSARATPPVPPVPPIPAAVAAPAAPQRPSVMSTPAVPGTPVAPGSEATPAPPAVPATQSQRTAAETSPESATRHKVLAKLKSKRGSHHGKDRVSTDSVEVDEGEVVDSAVSYGSSVTVKSGGVVQNDAVAFGGDVVLEPGAVVEGDAVAFGGTVKRDDGAVVEGETVSFGGLGEVVAKGVTTAVHSADDGHSAHERRDRGAESRVPGFLLRFALLFGLGFLAIMFVPGRMRLIESELSRDPVKCGATGLLGAIVLSVLSLALVVTLIGIPAAIALWTVGSVGVAIGVTAVASVLGARLPVFRGRNSHALALAAGLLLFLLIAKLPVFGPLAMAAVALVSLGALIRTRFGQPPKGTPQPDTSP